jgi:hypothetical protein
MTAEMASELIPQDLVPIGTGYVILMGVLAAGLRLQRRDASRSAHSEPGSAESGAAAPDDVEPSTAEPASAEPTSAESGGKRPGRVALRAAPGWPRFAVQVASTALGGYVLLMAVVVLYYYGVARVAGQFLASAFTGSALLLAVSLPLFAAASWLVQRRRGR